MMPSSKLRTIVLTLVALCFVSCETKNSPSPEPAMMCLEVNGERYDVPLPCHENLNLRTLCSEFAADIKVLNYSDFKSITIADQPVVNGAVSYTLPTDLTTAGYIPIDYTTATQQGSFLVNAYPEDIPGIAHQGKGQIPGHFYLSFIYQPLIMKYDNDGQLLYYRFEPTEDNGTFQELGFWDFKKHVFSGKTYYSYHAPDPEFSDRAFTGYVPGMRILLDDHYNPVDTIHALRSLDGYLSEGSPLDGHDFYFFSPTHWIASASYVEREIDGTIRAVAYLQEVDHGQVVHDWWSTDHDELLEWGSPAFDTSYDYVHFNSIDVLPNGNWLVSFRALSSVVCVNPQDGSILWRINGEALDPSYNFSGQHYVRYHEDNGQEQITLFDNGNAHDPSVTHAIRLDINNMDDGEIINGRNLLHVSDYFTQACGALQDFGSRGFVMGWGWSTQVGNCTRLVSEHDADGNEVFHLNRTDEDPHSVNPSYRCVKYE